MKTDEKDRTDRFFKEVTNSVWTNKWFCIFFFVGIVSLIIFLNYVIGNSELPLWLKFILLG